MSGPIAGFALERTERFTLSGGVSGDEYRIDLALPDGEVPDAGWPVLYLLDATGSFATCVEALRRMGRRPAATGVSPMVVAGVSAPHGYDVARRQRDYTTPKGGSAEPEEGQAAAFLDFLDREVKAAVAERLPVDPGRQTLYGHSLGGYFVLWALTARPHAYRNYAAISPSTWWDKPLLLAGAANLPNGAANLFLTIGEWEEALPPWQVSAPDSESVRARRAARNMIGGAREIAGAFEAALGGGRVRFAIMPEEDHVSIISTAMSRVLRLASSGSGD